MPLALDALIILGNRVRYRLIHLFDRQSLAGRGFSENSG
jgi:hypothetical protein